MFQPTGTSIGRAKIYKCWGCQGTLTSEDEPAWVA
jgi:hypothetical protein